MKRHSIAIVTVLVVSLSACGKKETPEPAPDTKPAASAPAPPTVDDGAAKVAAAASLAAEAKAKEATVLKLQTVKEEQVKKDKAAADVKAKAEAAIRAASQSEFAPIRRPIAVPIILPALPPAQSSQPAPSVPIAVPKDTSEPKP